MDAGDPDEWEKVIRVNMLAPMRLMRRLTPAMVEKGEGVIINIDSSAGLAPKPGNAVYSSSKYAPPSPSFPLLYKLWHTCIIRTYMLAVLAIALSSSLIAVLV